MSLKDKLLKASTNKYASSLEDSIYFKDRDEISTPVPMVNVALSGRCDGGFRSGLTMLAGPSKNFKSGFALLLASSYLRKYPEAQMLFYDSEFGLPENYFDMFGINIKQVLHMPVVDVEELKNQTLNHLQAIERGDKVIMVMDSVGNLASKKEVDDAIEGKNVADMSRAKALKSLFRMITPHFGLKDIPVIAVNHTYKEIGMFPKDIVGGGTGAYFSSDTIWILGRRQEKDGSDLTGFNFVINVEKSRFVKEKSQIPINVSFDKGIQKWAGLFDVAVDLGFIKSPTKGWYTYGVDDTKFRRGDVEYDDEFWTRVFDTDDFKNAIEKKYALSSENVVHVEEGED